jgi:hypothetical protein
MKIVNDSNKQTIDLDILIEETFQKYDAVFFSEIEGQLFSYRPLGRKEYKDIITNENISDFDKQDHIVKTALIYPVDFDLDSCPAGIPDKLCQDIVEKSCLDPESMIYLLHMKRQEAEQLGSEMVCVIAEAFPSYTIDEIESWNNFKFMKVYAQAEWVLKNIRGIQFQFDVIDYLAEIAGVSGEELEEMGIVREEESTYEPPQRVQTQVPTSSYTPQPQSQPQPQTPPQQGNSKMSPEQMRAYQDFIRQHPEFAEAMQYDSAFTGFESNKMNTTNPALRPGWYHNH